MTTPRAGSCRPECSCSGETPSERSNRRAFVLKACCSRSAKLPIFCALIPVQPDSSNLTDIGCPSVWRNFIAILAPDEVVISSIRMPCSVFVLRLIQPLLPSAVVIRAQDMSSDSHTVATCWPLRDEYVMRVACRRSSCRVS
jgi:hypothetical protein